MTTIFNIFEALFSNSNKNISKEVRLQIIKADCDNPNTSDAYCDSEKPYISNFQ